MTADVGQPSEVVLAQRLLDGDATAFDPFVEAIRNKLFQFSFLTCGQREDAEEVAQETLLKVFENFHQLREPRNVRSWVFRIARNFCQMKRRKSVFAPKEELSLDELQPEWRQDGPGRRLEIADWSALPDARAISSETATALRQAIRELPEMYRSTLLLRDVEGLSTREAAEVLEVNEDVIKTRLHRARLSVRKFLDERMRGAVRTRAEAVS